MPPGENSRRNKTMRINTNLTALNTFTQYSKNNNTISKSVEKLSSGSAINSASDNAAGLAISEKMRAQIRGLDKAATNAQDAISLVQTAEGSLGESTAILQRMRELAVQSASDTNGDDIDREALQDEFSQLQEELNDIAKNTTFNKKNLLDGSLSASTKSLSKTFLRNSGMTIDIGNATAGDYNFSVTTKLVSAAVAGRAPTNLEIVLGDAAGYFSNAAAPNEVRLGTEAAESALLNGNYKLSAEYGDDGNITVTAKGDNGQSFEAKIIAADLEKLDNAAPADRKITMVFNAEADDAFKVTLGLSNNIASTANNYETLATNISKMYVSVTGGVTPKDAEYGVFANLTGAQSIRLEAGMSSVSFSNGVKVNFDTLTASSIDTQNKAALTTSITFNGNGNNGLANSASAAFSNLNAYDDSSIINGNGSISITASDGNNITFTFVDSASNSYTSTVNTSELKLAPASELTGTGGVNTLTFKDGNGKASFTLDMTVTNAGGNNFAALTTATTSSLTVENAGHNYASIFGDNSNGLSSSTASSFSVEEKFNSGLTFQVGANEGDEMTIYIEKMDSNYLGVGSSDIATQEAASSAITAIDKAISQVSSQRAYLGAIQNRLDHKIANLDTSSANLTSAESQIRDVDMAREMTTFTNANILSQAATAMLAQANSLPQGVLSLLQG
jgi:flagellin